MGKANFTNRLLSLSVLIGLGPVLVTLGLYFIVSGPLEGTQLLLVLAVSYTVFFLLGAWLLRRLVVNPLFADIEQKSTDFEKDTRKYQLTIKKLKKTLAANEKTIDHQMQKNLQAATSLEVSKVENSLNLGNLHHEIRTPLSGVVAAVEMIEQVAHQAIVKAIRLKFISGLPPEVRSIIQDSDEYRQIHTVLDEILKPSASLMENTLDHLLESLKGIQGSNLSLHIAPFPLRNLLQGTVKGYQKIAEDKGLHFESVITNNTNLPASSLYYKSDIARIGQVLSNLLSNAVRFTQQGSVQLRVDVNLADDEQKHKIRFIITDTGCGIGEQEATGIFQLFNVGGDPSKKEFAGLGAGLPLCRKIADALQGKVYLATTVAGKGSEFIFEVDLETSDAQELPEDSELGQKPHKISLLYVEDSKTNRSVFKQYCDRASINLQLAVDGHDGWQKYQGFDFDALVVDCWMPGKNGFELVEEIRAHEQSHNLPRVPIFALTADPTDINHQRCVDAGFDEFLTKPYKMDTFNFIIERTEAIKEQVAAVAE
jgi:signal transduction histidine kinase/CheY-like chemotaxis protein